MDMARLCGFVLGVGLMLFSLFMTAAITASALWAVSGF